LEAPIGVEKWKILTIKKDKAEQELVGASRKSKPDIRHGGETTRTASMKIF
jgi:hypothetical protein